MKIINQRPHIKMKTIHNRLELVSEALAYGFNYGIFWHSEELGDMIDLYTLPVKGSKKLY